MNKNFIFLGISFVIARNRQDSESVERGSGIWAELRSSISLAHHRPRRCNLGVERDAQDQLFASWPRLSEPGAREELQIPIENIYIFSHISNLSNNPSSRSNMTTGRPQINTISDNRLSHFLLYPQINKLIRWLRKNFIRALSAQLCENLYQILICRAQLRKFWFLYLRNASRAGHKSLQSYVGVNKRVKLMRGMIVSQKKDSSLLIIHKISAIVLEKLGVHLIGSRAIILATLTAYCDFGVSFLVNIFCWSFDHKN